MSNYEIKIKREHTAQTRQIICFLADDKYDSFLNDSPMHRSETLSWTGHRKEINLAAKKSGDIKKVIISEVTSFRKAAMRNAAAIREYGSLDDFNKMTLIIETYIVKSVATMYDIG